MLRAQIDRTTAKLHENFKPFRPKKQLIPPCIMLNRRCSVEFYSHRLCVTFFAPPSLCYGRAGLKQILRLRSGCNQTRPYRTLPARMNSFGRGKFKANLPPCGPPLDLPGPRTSYLTSRMIFSL